VRQMNPALAAHLAGGATTLCWCWKLSRQDGVTFGFTDHDRDLVLDDMRYEARSGFSGTEIEEALGLSPDNLETTGALSADAIHEADLAAGRFDGALAEIWLVNWQDATQRHLLRAGSLGEVTRDGLAFQAELRGLSHALSLPKGRIFQHGCDAVPGDARCGVNLNAPAFRAQVTITVAEEGGRLLGVTGLGAYADGWFTRGLAKLASGEEMEIKSHREASIELWRTPSAMPQTGDALTLLAGCDRAFATCRDKFANTDNFRGFPHMPGNDYLATYPVRG
jgi:uncharacterized phage protein (TIGR02218 family)